MIDDDDDDDDDDNVDDDNDDNDEDSFWEEDNAARNADDDYNHDDSFDKDDDDDDDNDDDDEDHGEEEADEYDDQDDDDDDDGDGDDGDDDYDGDDGDDDDNGFFSAVADLAPSIVKKVLMSNRTSKNQQKNSGAWPTNKMKTITRKALRARRKKVKPTRSATLTHYLEIGFAERSLTLQNRSLQNSGSIYAVCSAWCNMVVITERSYTLSQVRRL